MHNKNQFALTLAILTALAGISTIVSFLISKDFKCSIINHLWNLESGICSDNKDLPNIIKLFILNETGEPLSDVEVEFIGVNSQTRYTDKRGFVEAQITNKGNILTRISAKGYPVQTSYIDLDTPQNIIQEIRLNQAGKPIIRISPKGYPVPSSSGLNTPTPEIPPTIPADDTSQKCISLRYLYLPNYPVFKDQPPYDVGVVLYTTPGYPANLAGLQRGDLIVSVNGQSLKAKGDLEKIIANLKVGDLAHIRVFHFAHSSINENAVYVYPPYQDKTFKVSVRCY